VSIVDGIVLAALLLMIVVMLGVMRETAILRGETASLKQLIIDPPAPSFIGDKLPDVLAQHLTFFADQGDMGQRQALARAHVILFVKPNCEGCEALIAQVKGAIAAKLIAQDDLSCVVLATSEEAHHFQLARSVSRNTVLDPQGDLLKACEVRGTPTQLAIWADTLHVFDYTMGGDVEWIRQRLQASQGIAAAPPLLERPARAS